VSPGGRQSDPSLSCFSNKHRDQKTGSWVIGIQGRRSLQVGAAQELRSQDLLGPASAARELPVVLEAVRPEWFPVSYVAKVGWEGPPMPCSS